MPFLEFGMFCACILILGAGVLVFLKIWEQVERRRDAGGTKIVNDPLRVEKRQQLATQKEVEALGIRVEKDIEEIRSALEGDRKTARTAIGRVHSRIDVAVENTAEIKGTLSQIAKTVELLLHKQTETNTPRLPK